MDELPDSLPVFLIPDIPFNLETLGIIFPYSLTMMVVGLLESLMTATIVDDLTDTKSDKNRECVGQGVANIATGFIGGMAGCAMIGQSVINIKSGGRGRLSTFVAGFFFAHKVARIMRVTSLAEDEGRVRTYQVFGQVFFASADRFANAFDYKGVIEKVRIDVSRAHFWDVTAVSALDKVVLKFRRERTEVEVVSLNEASATLVDKFGVHDKDGAHDIVIGH